jgi:hypothetical protein
LYLVFVNTFDVDPKRKAGSSIRVQGFILYDVSAALKMLGQLHIEEFQQLAGGSKLVMPVKNKIKP